MHDVIRQTDRQKHTHTQSYVLQGNGSNDYRAEYHKIHRCQAENSRMLVVNRTCSSGQVQVTKKKK